VRKCLCLTATLLVAAGCSGGPVSVADVSATYNLVSVDDVPVPATIYTTADSTAEITGGQLSLLTNEQYTITIDYRVTVDGPGGPDVQTPQYLDLGPYAVDGDFVLLRSTTPGLTYAGLIEGSTITIEITRAFGTGPRLVLAYRR
jgi:hypothetical protein